MCTVKGSNKFCKTMRKENTITNYSFLAITKTCFTWKYLLMSDQINVSTWTPRRSGQWRSQQLTSSVDIPSSLGWGCCINDCVIERDPLSTWWRPTYRYLFNPPPSKDKQAFGCLWSVRVNKIKAARKCQLQGPDVYSLKFQTRRSGTALTSDLSEAHRTP